METLEIGTQFFYWSGIIWWCCIVIVLTVIIITRPDITKEENKRIYYDKVKDRLEGLKSDDMHPGYHDIDEFYKDDYEDGTEQHPYIHEKD